MENNLKKTVSVKEIFDLLSSKPPESWCTGSYENSGKYCALGHINNYYSDSSNHSSLERPIRMKISEFIKSKYALNHTDIINVNDTTGVNNYTEEHPKDRVLHLLNDMIDAGIYDF